MDDRFFGRGGFRQRLFVKVGFQDRFDALVAVGFQKQGAAAGGLHPLGRVPFSQPHDAQAGAETLLRMFAALHDAGSQISGVGSVFTRPVHDPGGGPFQIFLMGLGHMFRQRGVFIFFVTARMGGNAAVLEQYLHGGGRHPCLHLFFYKLIGDAVVVTVNLDMVVDVDPDLLPFGILIRNGRKGF